MHGTGMMFTPPGEIIEATFFKGKIQDGRVKILVSLFYC